MAYLPVGKAAQALGMHENTVRKHADNGNLPSIRSPSGQRLIDVDAYLRGAKPATVVCYCRVSGNHQKNDLARQVVYMRERYPDAEIITDIGSGLNYKRKGLRALLERIHRGDKLTVVVAHKDRLARFGAEVFAYLLGQNGGELVVLNRDTLSPEEEVCADVLSILTVFSARVNGLRRYHNQIKEDQTLLDRSAKGTG